MFELLLNNKINGLKIVVESFQDASISNTNSINWIVSDLRDKYKNEKNMNIIFREIEISDNANIEELYSNIEWINFIWCSNSKDKRKINILREVIYEI